MKKMMDIFLEPLRNADRRALTVIRLSLVAVIIGCMVAAVDSVIVYLFTLALLYTIMRIISDCEEGGDDDA